uniref:Uncharacterized protein n=1 Tax=Loa loa TaxID=7209 RepID=A0A1I7VCE1_LOALO
MINLNLEALSTTALPTVGGLVEGIRDNLKQSNETVVSPESGSKINIVTSIPPLTQDNISRPATVSCIQQSQTNFDEDEELMFKNFPWLKVQIFIT